MKNVLGGKVRLFISSGAPLSIAVKNFLTVVFNAPIIEAFGMTECAGCLTSTLKWERKGGHVGGILPCNRLQLRDVPELNLSTDDRLPAGEMYIKGNSVFKGYFKNPDLTSKALDDDGWLKVGDVCELNPNGSIKILDRVGEIKKLQNGQFIVPQKLENIYVNCPLVDQIYIDINPTYNFLIAVVSLVEERLQQFAEVNGLEGDVKKLIKTQDVEYGVLKQLERAANINKLDNIEKILRVHIVPERFTVKNGQTTSTLKLKREAIKEKYKRELDILYASCFDEKYKDHNIQHYNAN